MPTVTVDFVARGADASSWHLVLVEQGPWPATDITSELRRVQDRLYGCLDAALDGKVAERFPDSAGQRITIRLDAYDLPEVEVRGFFSAFANRVLKTPDYATALAGSRWVSGFEFELSLRKLPP
jgi:hypothetical protein